MTQAGNLVECVCKAGDGVKRNKLSKGGGHETTCQGCGAAFTMKIHVDTCPQCGGIHAITPIHKDGSRTNIPGRVIPLV